MIDANRVIGALQQQIAELALNAAMHEARARQLEEELAELRAGTPAEAE